MDIVQFVRWRCFRFPIDCAFHIIFIIVIIINGTGLIITHPPSQLTCVRVLHPLQLPLPLHYVVSVALHHIVKFDALIG